MQQFFSQFAAHIDQSGQIVAQTFQGSQIVGVSVAKYQEMQKIAEEATAKAEGYYKQLVDAGLITPKLTPEEQIAALTAQVAQLAQQNAALTQQVQGVMDVFAEPKKEAKR